MPLKYSTPDPSHNSYKTFPDRFGASWARKIGARHLTRRPVALIEREARKRDALTGRRRIAASAVIATSIQNTTER